MPFVIIAVAAAVIVFANFYNKKVNSFQKQTKKKNLVMLAIDIETENLLPPLLCDTPSSTITTTTAILPLPEITCACLFDGKHSYKLRMQGLPKIEMENNIKILLELLDSADTLCGYNAVLFDLEFIRRHFSIDNKRFSAWVSKCIDPFMCVKYLSCTPCKLQHLLELNNMESKTGSGADAIELAKNQEWDKLLDYCLMDAKLTYNLCSLEWIKLTPILSCRLNVVTDPPVFKLITASSHVNLLDIKAKMFPSLLLEINDTVGHDNKCFNMVY